MAMSVDALSGLSVSSGLGQRNTESTSTRVGIIDLPTELLLEIAKYLPLRSLIALRHVNRLWCSVVCAAAVPTEYGLPESTRALLEAWLVAVSPNKLENNLSRQVSRPRYGVRRSSSGMIEDKGTLTDAARTAYTFAVKRYAMSFQWCTHEEPGLSDEFLTWLFEWPSHAALDVGFSPSTAGDLEDAATAGLSPYNVTHSLFNSASYITLGADRVPVYYQERIILMVALEGEDVLLPRIRLIEDPPDQSFDKGSSDYVHALQKTSIRLKAMNPNETNTEGTFKGNWARFLPISMAVKAPSAQISGSDDMGMDLDVETEDKPAVPLYVLSGRGLGETLTGCVCTLGPNATLNIEARSWAEFLISRCSSTIEAKASVDEIGHDASSNSSLASRLSPPERDNASSPTLHTVLSDVDTVHETEGRGTEGLISSPPAANEPPSRCETTPLVQDVCTPTIMSSSQAQHDLYHASDSTQLGKPSPHRTLSCSRSPINPLRLKLADTALNSSRRDFLYGLALLAIAIALSRY